MVIRPSDMENGVLEKSWFEIGDCVRKFSRMIQIGAQVDGGVHG